ncbi:MAG TPA: YkgJ family cysteine cluster protein [Candidatus Lokiarchaeia archaeon]|nr:YkgJ family cysteine cluster protein [Candidatus Lokiarchaeia archaeon]
MNQECLPLDDRVFSADNEPETCDCSGDCCTNHSILLTSQDVIRILDHVPSVNPRDLVVFYVSYAGYVDIDVLAGYPAIMLENEPCYLGLRFLTDEALGAQRCPFLDTTSHLCKIQEFKPMVCRAYPFLYTDGKITRHERTRCKEPYHPRNPADIESLRETLRQAYTEFEAFKLEIEAWNESGQTDSPDALFKALFKI